MELIGRGRSAEIFALDERTVLRRVRPDRDAAAEARLLRHLSEVGYPVPRVIRVDGRDLVMERIGGPDLLGALQSGELGLRESMTILGDLARRLSEVPAPDWLATAPDAEGAAPPLAHLDFHHENVMLGPDGPVVIDWEGSKRADRALDVAVTCVILLTDVKAREHLGSAASGLVDVFVAASGVDPEPAMERAVRRRLRDRNLSDAELAIVAELLPGSPPTA